MSSRHVPIVALVAAAGCAAPSADLSGVDRFWDVADVLRADELPDEAAWEDLLSTPGCATMAAHDGSDRALRELLPVA